MTTATATLLKKTEPPVPFDAERTAQILDRFYRDGYAVIPNILTRDEIEALRAGIDRMMDNQEKYTASNNLYAPWVGVRMFETDRVFRDLLVREPIISLAEAVLGKNCHLMAQNAVRNAPGIAIDSFHADMDPDGPTQVEFECPPGMERHDARYRLPVFRMTVQILLSDVDSIEDGPTQFIPASHYAGRGPGDPKNPIFEGRGPESIYGKAGDIYLHNGQCWHRGAPNTGKRTRYLLQNAYCQRWVAQRFYPFLNYRMPDHVLEGADERLLRVLGKHPKGPYG